MEDSGKHSKSKLLNPWMLQFQKMGLELKCPLCSCIPDCSRPASECAVCNMQYVQRGNLSSTTASVAKIPYLRHVPFVENMVAIYRSLDAAFCANLFQHRSSDDMRVLEPCQTLLNSTFNNTMAEEPFKTLLRDCPPMFSRTTDKHIKVPSSLHHSIEAGMGKNHKYENTGVAAHGKAEEFEISCKGGVGFSSEKNDNLMRCSQLDGGSCKECGVVEMDMNQVTQSLPDSPPFCDTKGSDNDCSDQDSEHLLPAERLESYSLKRASKENGILDKRTQLKSESSAFMRELKRQKKVSHGNNDIQPSVAHHSKPVASSCNLHLKSEKDSDSCSNTSICSFCQSSKTSEDTGPMLHYRNGNLVTGDAAFQPNVIHVHRVCIDWAPQVYFVDEAVKNLEREVARGAKLKCSKCGLKGAALGCYVRSCRRTYHVPCAMGISACRWDDKEFLMLCPAHSHVNFPSEKSKSKKQASSQKHPVSSHLLPQQSNPPVASHDHGKDLVFCGSALSADEKILMINFARRIGASVTHFWTPNVTHVVAATDANGACSRTLKVLMAILNGQWVLKIDWINACMKAMHPVEEEPYEISLDNHGCHGGPKAGRLRALLSEPKLFSGINIYFAGDYMPDYKEDLEDLVLMAGGNVLRNKEELEVESRKGKEAPSKLLIVYNIDPPQGCRLGEEVSILWQRLNEAEDLASSTGSQVIGHMWILESIAACKLQPFIS